MQDGCSDPYTFDDVTSDFPETKIVPCHGGRGFFYHIAEFLVKRMENNNELLRR
jgi:predicted TIM-barrel fold metal-dependent hydrolase